MRKISALFIVCFYLLASTGVAVNVHFCKGKVASVNVGFLQIEKGCKCKKNSSKRSCCADKSTFVKLKDSQEKMASNRTAEVKCKALFYNAFVSVYSVSKVSLQNVYCAMERPPIHCKQHVAAKKVLRI